MPKPWKEALHEQQAMQRHDWNTLGIPREGQSVMGDLLGRFIPGRTLSAFQFVTTELAMWLAASGEKGIKLTSQTQRTLTRLVRHRQCDTYTVADVTIPQTRSAFRELLGLCRKLGVLDRKDLQDVFMGK